MSRTEALIQAQMALDCAHWAYTSKILLDGRPFNFSRHEYQLDPMQSEAVEQCSRKGAQIGWTSIKMLKSIHGLIYGRYPQGVLYLFPTRDDVTDFSKGRFQPLINDNKQINKFVKDTDAANIKRIGRGMLYFRGAKSTRTIGGFKKTSSQLKCHDDQTEILTRNQWKKFSEVALGEEVATRSPSGDFMWQKVTHIHQYRHSGKMLHFKSRGFDMCVTPNHRLLLCMAQGGKKDREWLDLAENITTSRTHIHAIRTSGKWKGCVPDFIITKNTGNGWNHFLNIQGNRINSRWKPRHPDRLVNLKYWVAFLGLYVSEGSVEGVNGEALEPGKGRISISQSDKSKHLKRIQHILDMLPCKWNRSYSNFRTCDREMAELLFPIGNKYNKALPDWVLDLPTRYLRLLWRYAVMGDGHVYENGMVSYATASKKLADQFQEILHKCGCNASIREHQPTDHRSTMEDGREINSYATMYWVFEREWATSVVPKPEEVGYDGDVYCVSVPNGTLLTRRNGYTVWSGNSIPVDRIVFDEVDEMEPSMIDLALERVSHSDVCELDFIGTPTIPDYGIDIRWQKSDQRLWFLRCAACNVETCLEQEFEDNGWENQRVLVEMDDGRVAKVCRSCGREFQPDDERRWVTSYPSRSKDLVGWWVSQLNSHYVSPETILNAFNDTKRSLAETYNSKIGMPYIEAQNRLSMEEVLDCCGDHGIALSDPGPCSMGVDQGKGLHVVIGKRSWGATGNIVHVGEYKDWEEIDGLIRRFHVSCGVVDGQPEMRAAQALVSRFPGRMWVHFYDEHRRGPAMWNEQTMRVSRNRTESLDSSHNEIASRLVVLPRRCREMEVFAKQLSNTAKRLEEDEESGSKRYVYVKLGPDHYRHAFTLEGLARAYGANNIFAECDMS